MDCIDVPLPTPATGVVVRRCADGSEEILVLSNDGFRTLEGGSHGQPYSVGALLPLSDAEGRPYTPSGSTWRAVFEPLSGCVFFREGHALMRLDAGNVVTLAAGHKTKQGTADGEGGAARFHSCVPLAADGRGAVYLLDVVPSTSSSYGSRHVDNSGMAVRVVSPAPCCGTNGRESADGTSDAAADGLAEDQNNAVGRSGVEGSAAYEAAVCEDGSDEARAAGAFTVSTVLGVTSPSRTWVALAYAPAYDSLLCCTATAVYGISLDASDSSQGPQLQVGYEGPANKMDGFAPSARFKNITGCFMDARGTLYLTDGGALRSLDAWGEVQTLLSTGSSSGGSSSGPHQLACLPGCDGGLAACSNTTACLTLLMPGESKMTYSGAVGTRSGAPTRRLGELLRSPCQGTPLVTVSVEGEAFAAHRSVLCAGSEFFARMLEGGFAEGSAGPAEPVELKEADPGAFQALLEYMYTGRLDVPNPLLRPTCELAGRLLLPSELQGWLQGHLLGRATPGSAIDDLIWADRHGMSDLAAQLKERIVRHRALVKAWGGEVRAALQRLARHSTPLLIELAWLLL